MKFVEQWWKKWSTWLIGVSGALAWAAPFMPELQAVIPAEWYKWAFIVIFIARIVSQRPPNAAP